MERKHILLGIGGGIAAYKIPELIRMLTEREFDVATVLTSAGSKFVTPTTLAAVSQNRVRHDLWDEEAERSMSHIELAKWADILVIAPTTANLMSRLAHGIANDLLTTIYLATVAPVVIAPSMNQAMWTKSATQRNLAQLKQDCVLVVGPDYGDQACGDVGQGRMSSPETIANFVSDQLKERDLVMEGLNVVVTAGPTREAIDPVRFISNASSGRQGFAIAEAAREAGANVTLISGPVSLETPIGVDRINVTTAEEMRQVVKQRTSNCDIFFSVAAVGDYRPINPSTKKIKRSSQEGEVLELKFVQNEDIVHMVASQEVKPFVVGFAAETHSAIEFGRKKLEEKNLDAIVINDVSNKEIGFDSENNAVTVVQAQGTTTLPKQSKIDIARKIVSLIASSRLVSSLSVPTTV